MAVEKHNGTPWPRVSYGHGHREDVVGPSMEDLRAPAGTEPCDACGTLVQPKGDHYSVHFPDKTSQKPCPRSWPAKAKAKACP